MQLQDGQPLGHKGIATLKRRYFTLHRRRKRASALGFPLIAQRCSRSLPRRPAAVLASPQVDLASSGIFALSDRQPHEASMAQAGVAESLRYVCSQFFDLAPPAQPVSPPQSHPNLYIMHSSTRMDKLDTVPAAAGSAGPSSGTTSMLHDVSVCFIALSSSQYAHPGPPLDIPSNLHRGRVLLVSNRLR